MNQRAPEEIGRIVQTPGVLGGRPRLDGTRIGTANVWGFQEGGASIEEILAAYPSLDRVDVEAALAYEAALRRMIG